jgi:ABC-type spermidine/putrescine transport system permease subunit II
MFWSGYLGDKMNLWLARRRDGTHLPEDSLISLIVPTIVSAIGIIVYALSTNDPTKYSSWGIIMGKSHYTMAIDYAADFY